MMTFKRTASDDADFQDLVALLDAHLKHIDGDDHAFYAQFNKIVKLTNVIICYAGDKPVGCGAFKEYDPQKVEVKRMYVLPEYRGQGIAAGVLKELESWAVELNYTESILETGKRQPYAIRLYQKAGYSTIKNFAPYQTDENSVCMTKKLS